ncbi:hypothetical protein BDY21DRAFT_340852 [Lineolata rhizophorae]|uniref:Glucose-methanol-choline oxidoreductase N-terminal domain-containing protein n=1 Tax=Lineolata rhizophorae TaxID=578093 RepID=A0A6A6P3R3_9PEZI|nr:hypothetical protein BDY21DRAFT_340852 [Lineolata rhizophorae]
MAFIRIYEQDALLDAQQSIDYIIVGGGLVGCVIATRLAQADLSSSVLLIEAGTDPRNNEDTKTPAGALALHNSDLDWAYMSTPQKNLNGRTIYNAAGRGLSGGTNINYGAWARGDARDWNAWAKAIGDDSWNYENMLPFFRKTETHYNPKADPRQHGFDGPIHYNLASTAHPDAPFPLREQIFKAFIELGLKPIEDGNAGETEGVFELGQAWRDGKRQPAAIAYGLNGVKVLLETMVHRVLFDKTAEGTPTAIGVELVGGRKILAKKEVIVSAGAIRSTQILKLSGIGASSELQQHGIDVVVDNSDVGRNCFDHYTVFQFWKLRKPEDGLAVGPLWTNPGYLTTMPLEWCANESVPKDVLKKAFAADGVEIEDDNPYLALTHYKIILAYAPMVADWIGADIPVDGSHIATATMLQHPTSRGEVRLHSTNPIDPPLINANYCDTEVDRLILNQGTRRATTLMLETAAMKETIQGETPPRGMEPVTSNSRREVIETRVRSCGHTLFHLSGSLPMGKVVDSKFQVKGVNGLRVADASIMPSPISSPIQAPLYAVGERVAETILKG